MKRADTILIVDDDSVLLNTYCEKLEKQYHVLTALNGSRALDIMEQLDEIAVIISDHEMANINGIDLLTEVRKTSPDTVRIMLVESDVSDVLMAAINKCKVFALLVKPIDIEELIYSIDEGIKEFHRIRADMIHKKTGCQITQPFLIAMAERDPFTFDHTDRITEVCYIMGLEMGLSKQQLANLECLAQIHDIGNMVIPDRIIFKEGSLTKQEWQVIRQHPEKGFRIALSSSDILDIADLILKHHERWDGEGYPNGLKGKEIPLECRILQIAEAYDVMINDRPYKKAKSKEEALKEIEDCSGTQFDPEIVNLFFTLFS